MSSVAHRQPAPLSALPRRGVCHLSGTTSDQLSIRLDPLPAGVPVIIRYRMQAAPSASGVIEDVLDRLTQVAVELFPAWLPDGDAVETGRTSLDRAVVRMLAQQHAAKSEHFAPFLLSVAENAVDGREGSSRFPAEVQALGLSRILAAAYQRDAVVLLVTSGELPEDQQRSAAAAYEWLSNHGRFGVWLADQALSAIDRFPTVTAGFADPGTELTPSDDGSASPAVVEYPAPIGKPHPGSAAEQLLERHLAVCEWAVGRKWNTLHRGHPLAPPIRVDLMWEDERCVVELDGADHRTASKYADDRLRDNVLVLDAFAVLRFTNEEVVDDPHRVLGTIEQLLASRRQLKGTLL
jgi:very-short-patch-repair endonuclease